MSVVLLHRKLLQSSIITNSSLNNLNSTNNDNIVPQWCTTLALVSHLLAYVAVLIMLAIVLLLIIKFLGGFEDTSVEEFGPTETNPLRPGKTVSITYNYGTISHGDIEKGNCSSSSSSSSNSIGENNVQISSSEELYDGKLCVICYDEQRDCFFVPCGHCATCYVCAQRIFCEESKTCPVCRRLIGKVRRLLAS